MEEEEEIYYTDTVPQLEHKKLTKPAALVLCDHLHVPSHLVRLDQLLAKSPHIGTYVRYFALQIFGIRTTELVAEASILTAHVLPNLTNLGRLTLDPFVTGADNVLWETQPVFLTFQAALALPSLRCLDLFRYSFADIFLLESLLRHAKSLKRLSLLPLKFHATSCGNEGHIAPIVLLEHLELTHIANNVADAMVSGFNAVDIKHLRSVGISHSSIYLSLLKANVQTLQKIRYNHSSPPNPDLIDPDILEGSQSLHSIDIEQYPNQMVYTLQELGHLSHLKALSVITLSFSDFEGMDLYDSDSDTMGWPKLDAILEQAGDRLEEVRIRIWVVLPAPPALETTVRRLLPFVADKVSVHLY
ncbi:hypothetical protein C8J57DRAFT_1507280 [Mycena rebaudengoi]|nr:hypothetical protein C8J57DRAFT_1507280 [Mycena rebaudengoi]